MVYNYLITQQIKKININLDIGNLTTWYMFNIMPLGCPSCYIIHDDENETTSHIHCLVLFCDKLATDLIKLLPYADITKIDDLKQSWLYLTHNSKNSLEKIKYDESKIQYYCCSYDMFRQLWKHNTKNNKLNNIYDDICNDIFSGKYNSIVEVIKDYGGVVLNRYNAFDDLIKRVQYYEFGVSCDEFEKE